MNKHCNSATFSVDMATAGNKFKKDICISLSMSYMSHSIISMHSRFSSVHKYRSEKICPKSSEIRVFQKNVKVRLFKDDLIV